MQRLAAVAGFRELEQAGTLAAANKRIGNILRKNDVAENTLVINNQLFTEKSEQVLADKLILVKAKIAPLLAKADYAGVLTELSEMRDTVDAFFDQVMVMADDLAVRKNRLALLNQTRALFLEVADISYLQT